MSPSSSKHGPDVLTFFLPNIYGTLLTQNSRKWPSTWSYLLKAIPIYISMKNEDHNRINSRTEPKSRTLQKKFRYSFWVHYSARLYN